MSILRADSIRDRAGTGAPNFPNGATVTGVVTATSFSGNLSGNADTATTATSATTATTATSATTATTATTATNAQGLTGTPSITVQDVTIQGDLTVQGTTTTIDTVNLVIEDANIGIASVTSPSNSTADGAGFTIFGGADGDKTLVYNNTKKAFETNVAWSPDENRFNTVSEKVTRVADATVNLVYNSSSSNIGFATSPTGDITLNVTNIPTTSDFDDHILTFSVIVNQTGTARTCTAVTLNGVSKTINWAGGSLGAAIAGVTTTSGTDIYTFTGINTVGSASTADNYRVLGMVNGGFA